MFIYQLLFLTTDLQEQTHAVMSSGTRCQLALEVLSKGFEGVEHSQAPVSPEELQTVQYRID